jgi:LysM repeat protein
LRQLRALILVMLLAGSASAGTGSYTVRWGDTLSHVARRFGVPVSTLANANGINDPDRVLAGEKLSIPTGAVGTKSGPAAKSSPVGGQVHVVRAGENLTTIARKYGTSVSSLASANGLSQKNLVREGDRLQVPGGKWVCPVSGHYTVVNNWQAPRPGHRVHLGNDIFADRGTKVRAPVGGVVHHASGAVAGRAFYLTGDDGMTYYGAHLETMGPAGRVKAGALLGTVGNSGNASTTPPHLHWGMQPSSGAPVNPYATLSRWC